MLMKRGRQNPEVDSRQRKVPAQQGISRQTDLAEHQPTELQERPDPAHSSDSVAEFARIRIELNSCEFSYIMLISETLPAPSHRRFPARQTSDRRHILSICRGPA